MKVQIWMTPLGRNIQDLSRSRGLVQHLSRWIRSRLILVAAKLADFKIESTPIVSYNALIGEAVGGAYGPSIQLDSIV